MKKNYNSPKTEIINVELQQMIADSITKGGSYDGSTIIESRQQDTWVDHDTWDESETVNEEW